MKELIALIAANPGKYSIANSGLGTTPMLASELFKLTYKLDAASVPYNGGEPAVQSVVGNHTPIGFFTVPPAAPQIAAGNIRGLAVTSAKRSGALPDVPTMAEAGVPDQESETMQGIFVPAGTPKEIVDLLHDEIVKAMQSAGREGEMRADRLRRRRQMRSPTSWPISRKRSTNGTRSSSTPRFDRFSERVTPTCASSISARLQSGSIRRSPIRASISPK